MNANLTPAEKIEIRLRAAAAAENLLSINPEMANSSRFRFVEAIKEIKKLDKLLEKAGA